MFWFFVVEIARAFNQQQQQKHRQFFFCDSVRTKVREAGCEDGLHREKEILYAF